ncbi:hypothetical protein [Williamsia sp. R60]
MSLESTSTETTEALPEGGNTGEAENSSQKGNREARYRVERNDARAERDALAQRIERMQRAEVERVAGEHLSMAGDLFSLSGNELADYLTESGDIDAAKVSADVAEILAERPGLRKPAPAFDPTQGHGGSPKPKTEPSLAAMIRGTVAVPFGIHVAN